MNSNSSKGGVGICTVLGIVFVVLKLVGVIDWSWVWVLAPFWIPFALFVGVILIICLFAYVVAMVERL